MTEPATRARQADEMLQQRRELQRRWNDRERAALAKKETAEREATERHQAEVQRRMAAEVEQQRQIGLRARDLEAKIAALNAEIGAAHGQAQAALVSHDVATAGDLAARRLGLQDLLQQREVELIQLRRGR
jgi:hypothetical protein